MEEKLVQLMDELIEGQKKRLLSYGRKIIPYLTSDDIMQPNDFPELEENPSFRFEEGILDGLQVAKSALQRASKESSFSSE